MRVNQYIVLLLAAVLVACTPEPSVKVSVRQCADIPVGRASACVAVLDGKAYIFGGRDQNGRFLNDLWSYDPLTDTWTDLGGTPLKPRVKASIAAMENQVYMGLGYSANHAYVDSAYQQDWFAYTPQTGEWKRCADFPSKNSVAALTYVRSEKAYILYGNGRFFTSEIYAYTPSANSWEEAPRLHKRPRACFGACAATYDGELYFGTGFDTYNTSVWYAVDIARDQWTARQSVPGKGREWSSAASSEEYIYLFGGRYFGGDLTGGEVFGDYLRYSPAQDRWEHCGTMPCGRAENQIAFTISGKVYFGLGENEKGEIINHLYCIEE